MAVKVAVYARVSTDDKGQDPETQLLQLREYCRNNDLEIFKEYIDKGESGRKTSRPALDKMLRDAAHRRFKQVIVWKMDRLSRAGIKHVLDVLDYLKRYGISVVSITEPFLSTDTPMGELVLLILAWCAKMESQILSQRVKAGIERYKQKKGHWGRPRVKVTGEEVRALREMGFSYRAIAKQLGVSVGKVLELVRSQSNDHRESKMGAKGGMN